MISFVLGFCFMYGITERITKSIGKCQDKCIAKPPVKRKGESRGESRVGEGSLKVGANIIYVDRVL